MKPVRSVWALWGILSGPLLAGFYFSLLYAAATLACGSTQPADAMAQFRIFALAATALTLVAIAGVILSRGLRLRSNGPAQDNAENDRFIDIACLLLAMLSFAATIWVAMATFLVMTCSAG